ncbi:hypothetical protein EV702DRAFT_1195641 [Suillus placidus]|uniref:DUF6533 domain-containing protein n=1 Tax=Suillus placidus TaxID=48579 RepID=A0A9P7A0C2_9AGAM|nr:hypothetical protein EV702DRAFT_1195641 [Suillus placidus]
MPRSNLGCGLPVASFAAVVYDWILTFGQEFELIWVSRVPPSEEKRDDIIDLGQRQRWSLMSILYLAVRYAVMPYAITIMLSSTVYFALNWITISVTTMLCVITITRLHAMYQQSRKMLICLIVIAASIMITSGVVGEMVNTHVSGEELILSGTYMCTYDMGTSELLITMIWILNIIWEVLALCLALWVSVKHFRERSRSSAGRTVGDCFAVLIKTHMLYFASFVVVSCFNAGYLSPSLANSSSTVAEVYYGVLEIMSFTQMFVLGPRLVLSVREFNAKLVAGSDVRTSMTTIAFQELVHESTGSSSIAMETLSVG